MLRLLPPALLLMSLAAPEAAVALGLGEIHVDSTLHQPLAARIDLIGATRDDLANLTVRIADQETFLQHGVERPAFLGTLSLKASLDSQGNPILTVRSSEALTEPLITFLVDVHLPNGALIREYTVLLDPPALAPEHNGIESTLPASASASAPGSATSKIRASGTNDADQTYGTPSDKTYIVAPRDTLERIVANTGARSRSDRHRMMIAIFRANPGAFQTNLNNLRLGATLRYPSAAELAAISADEANREFASQMAAWHASDRRLRETTAVTSDAVTESKPVADTKRDTQSAETENVALAQRIESLEKSLDALRQDLKQPLVVQATTPVATAPVPAPALAPAAEEPQTSEELESEEVAPARPRAVPLAWVGGGLMLLLAAGAWFRRGHPGRDLRPTDTRAETGRETLEEQVPAIRRDPVTDQSLQSAATPRAFSKSALAQSYVVEETRNAAPASAGHPSAARGESSWFKNPGQPGAHEPAGGAATELASLELAMSRILEGATTVAAPTVEMGDATVEHTTTLAPLDTDMSDATAEVTAALAVLNTKVSDATGGNSSAPAALNDETADATVEHTTALVAPDGEMSDATVERTIAFPNPEMDTNTAHVVLASGLGEPPPFVERRKDPADVLRKALEREPDRSDLRLKLLELYYAAAAQNRRAFLEITRQLAKNEKLASAAEWSQIADMGRVIAPDEELFCDPPSSKAVA